MASQPKAPKPTDPTTIINAQEAANRVNRITPFGSQTYDAQGNLTTTLPQGTMNAFNNVSDLAGNKQQFIQAPTGTSQLQDAIMNKIASRYSGQPQGQSAKPSPTAMNGSGNLAPTQGAWNAMFNALGQNGMQGMGGMQMPQQQLTMPMVQGRPMQ